MIQAAVCYGGVSVRHQLSRVERGADIIVATPGRLIDFVEKGKLGLSKLKYFVLDEADRMLDMGFENVIRKMVGEMGMTAKEDRQTMMFSATFPESIQRMAGDFMKPYLFVTVGVVSSANKDVEQSLMQVTQFE